jgi:hypothetical protein
VAMNFEGRYKSVADYCGLSSPTDIGRQTVEDDRVWRVQRKWVVDKFCFRTSSWTSQLNIYCAITNDYQSTRLIYWTDPTFLVCQFLASFQEYTEIACSHPTTLTIFAIILQ